MGAGEQQQRALERVGPDVGPDDNGLHNGTSVPTPFTRR